MNPEQLVGLLDELEDQEDSVDVVVKEMYGARLPRVDGAARRPPARPPQRPVRPVTKARDTSADRDLVDEVLEAAKGPSARHYSSSADGQMFLNGRPVGFATRRPDGGLRFDFNNPSQVAPA